MYFFERGKKRMRTFFVKIATDNVSLFTFVKNNIKLKTLPLMVSRVSANRELVS